MNGFPPSHAVVAHSFRSPSLYSRGAPLNRGIVLRRQRPAPWQEEEEDEEDEEEADYEDKEMEEEKDNEEKEED